MSALVRAGMRALLNELPGVEVVAETGDGREALRLVRERKAPVERVPVRAAVLRDHARVPPLVDDSDEQEERARRDAVVDHLEDGALQAARIEREHPQHDEAEVRDR